MGRGPPLLHGLGPESIVAHQPRHAMLANPMALFAERPPDARTAVGLATVLMEHADCYQERPIGGRPSTLGTSAPRIIPDSAVDNTDYRSMQKVP